MFPFFVRQHTNRGSQIRGARWSSVAAAALSVLSLSAPAFAAAAPSDVVIYASDVTVAKGNFWQAASSSGANQMRMESTDKGGMADVALAAPADYFEATFTVTPNTPYHVWLRMRGTADTKWNESVWVQFSTALNTKGGAVYRIGTADALLVNLENCSGCGISGWGWQDKGYWTGQSPIVTFATAGPHTVRVQVREDGVQVDQIVLSPSTYFSKAPGAIVNDNTIVAKPAVPTVPTAPTAPAAPTAPTVPTATPFNGTPVALPGTLQAEAFDNGGEGLAYHDSEKANLGGVFRNEGVDITWATGGTALVGWVGGGEWLQYTVAVQTEGLYRAEFLVASAGPGGVFHLEMDGVDVSGPVTTPDTGGWQSWRTITATATLKAGRQTLRLMMDRSGPSGAVANFDWVQFTAVPVSVPAPPQVPAVVAPQPPVGGQLRVMTWNIRYGTDKSNRPALPQQVSLMASQNPDVIILQEVSIYDGDQPSLYRNQLQTATGKTWYSSWAPSCTSGGCLGNLILSRLPLQSASRIFMTPTASAQATVSVGGVPVTVFAAHLDVNTDVRTRELNQLIAWIGGFSGHKVLGVDLNSWHGEWWPKQLVAAMGGDTWFDVTGNKDLGYTIGNVRFDYLFRTGMTPLNCWVVTTDLSDHRPVVADYRVQ